MKNYFFKDENINENDLYFVCYMIECVARTLKQKNSYVVNKIGYEELIKKISLADVLHCENPKKVIHDWIEEYHLAEGNYDIKNVNKNLVDEIPAETQMGKVYKRLILQTLDEEENYVDAIIRIYNSSICSIIDNYNTSAYYTPSYILRQAYYADSFNAIN